MDERPQPGQLLRHAGPGRGGVLFPSVAAALASTEMRAGIAELSVTSASMIAAVTSILAGAGTALLLDAVGVPLATAVIVGVAATLLVYGLHMLWMYRRRRPATA